MPGSGRGKRTSWGGRGGPRSHRAGSPPRRPGTESRLSGAGGAAPTCSSPTKAKVSVAAQTQYPFNEVALLRQALEQRYYLSPCTTPHVFKGSQRMKPRYLKA